MNTFTASNEIVVKSYEDNRIEIKCSGFAASTHDLSVSEAEALREFFRAEEDERLGRWRWPENPDYVVYAPRPGFRPVNSTEPCDLFIINEEWGAGLAYLDAEYSSYDEEDRPFAAAGRAYFDAHPEPKPWHDAKPGEVWLLRIPTGPTFDHAPAVVSSSANGNAIFTAATYDAAGTEELALTASQITYATRIYPEEVAS